MKIKIYRSFDCLPFILYSLLFIGIYFLDMFTKKLALSTLSSGAYKVTSWLTFRLVYNRGIAWGIFSSNKTIPFIVITVLIAVITFLMIMVIRHSIHNRLVIGEMLIVAGSISNLADRIQYGAVIDFIQLSYRGWSWPIFNVADCCIILGVIFMVIQQYRSN